MRADYVNYTFDSTLGSVNYIEGKAREFAAAQGYENRELENVGAAVREAATNAVLHGNRCDPNKKIHLAMRHRFGSIEILLRDEGKGFDYEHLPDPLAPENLLKPSGRGVFLMRSYMDEVSFRHTRAGTEVKLVKHARRAITKGRTNTTGG
jgi:serine/threonine-protein kinase RsbW